LPLTGIRNAAVAGARTPLILSGGCRYSPEGKGRGLADKQGQGGVTDTGPSLSLIFSPAGIWFF